MCPLPAPATNFTANLDISCASKQPQPQPPQPQQQQGQLTQPLRKRAMVDGPVSPPHVGSPLSDDPVSDMESDAHDFDYNELDRLVDDIKIILGPTSGLDSEEIDEQVLVDRLTEYVSQDEHWSKYAFVDTAYDYTRNLVSDINHKANLLILVWSPGCGSETHDHANAHCVVKMLSGTLRETLFDMPDPENPHKLTVKRVTDFTRDQVSYMSDKLGLHRMENPSPDVPAISMHLYTPPHAANFGCNVYDEATGEKKHVRCSLYSKMGVRL